MGESLSKNLQFQLGGGGEETKKSENAQYIPCSRASEEQKFSTYL